MLGLGMQIEYLVVRGLDAVDAQDGPEARDYPVLPVHERPVAIERKDLVLVCFHNVLPLADTVRKVSHGHLAA